MIADSAAVAPTEAAAEESVVELCSSLLEEE
jgi:hypothetical protein